MGWTAGSGTFNISRPHVKAAALSLLCIANLAAGAIELTGVSVAPTDSRFLLTDTSTGVTSHWLGVGDSFGGCVIISFDARSDVLDVKSGTAMYHLQLRPPSKVRPAPAPLKHSNAYWIVQNLEYYFAKDNVMLVDTKIDGSFVIMTPREVFKGSDYAIGKAIKIPLNLFPFGGDKNNFVAQPFVVAIPAAENPFGSGVYTMAGVDGDLVGPFRLDDFRAYKNAASVPPKQ